MAREKRPTYNKTQLMVERDFERHVFHRDRFAHYLRWSYAMRKIARNGNWRELTVLDVGCGDANLMKALYVNQRSPRLYWGIDVRDSLIAQLKEDWAGHDCIFTCQDAVTEPLPPAAGDSDGIRPWDFITCFEVMEHVGKENAVKLLMNMKSVMRPETTLLVSTPCYDEKVGAAGNHMINGQVGELTYAEMGTICAAGFEIVAKYGTFASKRDLLGVAKEGDRDLFERLEKFHDTEIMSVMLAPLYPEASRNVMWELRLPR